MSFAGLKLRPMGLRPCRTEMIVMAFSLRAYEIAAVDCIDFLSTDAVLQPRLGRAFRFRRQFQKKSFGFFLGERSASFAASTAC